MVPNRPPHSADSAHPSHLPSPGQPGAQAPGSPRPSQASKRRALKLAAAGLGVAGLVAGLLCPSRASAYAEDVHYQLALRGLQNSGLSDVAAPVNLIAAAAVREAIDSHARRSPTLRDAWIKRYPSPADFDDWAFKYFLLLEPSSKVVGIDRLDDRITATSKLYDLVALGTRAPDEDWRNRERVAYTPQRQPLKDSAGAPVPADPALLNMGKLGSLSSQAHAHYGLAQVEFSGDSEVLKSDPRRFARKPGYERAPILTLAAEMSQEHLDIALLAALTDAPSAREMSWLYAGCGFHYLEDVGNQIHTVQVGLYDFFQDAFFERLKMGLLSGGGYVTPMRSLASIGIEILSSHHVLSEHLSRKRLLAAVAGDTDPDGVRLMQAITIEDPAFSAQLDSALAALGSAPEKGEFAQAITRTLIDVSSHEGDAVYRATRAIADPRLRTRHYVYDENRDDPEGALIPRSTANESSYRDFFSLQERAFRRVGTALRRWVALQQKAVSITNADERAALRNTIVERLAARQLKMLDAQDARLADYLQHPVQLATGPEKSPGLLAADVGILALVLLGGYRLFRRFRRKQSA